MNGFIQLYNMQQYIHQSHSKNKINNPTTYNHTKNTTKHPNNASSATLKLPFQIIRIMNPIPQENLKKLTLSFLKQMQPNPV